MSRRALFALIAATCWSAPAEAAELPWEEALDRAANTGERIVVEVRARWCETSETLDTEALTDPRVSLPLEHWIVVQVDVDRRPDLHRLFHARGHEGLPTVHFLDSSGRELERGGALEPAELAAVLTRLTLEERRGEPLLPAAHGASGIVEADTLLARGSRHLLRAVPDGLTPVETDFLVHLACADPFHFAAKLGEVAHTAADSATAGRCIPPPTTLAFRAARLELLVADAVCSPERSISNRDAAARTVTFVLEELLDADSELFAAGGNDATLFLGANARLAAALVSAGRLWTERSWVRIGERTRAAIARGFAEDEHLLRWREDPDRGEAMLEDWTEWGLLLLASDSAEDRAKAREIGRAIRSRFVAPGGRLVAKTSDAHAVRETADPGEDGARTVLFFAKSGLAFDDGELTFQALELLNGLGKSQPPCGPAGLGLAALELARE